mmetsp:Transcript_41387/g.99707  ORF Transcript_41387/g.99707 Transcript_41387/m.99707 type:complete len:486 (-) Transcript_41387:797-2254(-)
MSTLFPWLLLLIIGELKGISCFCPNYFNYYERAINKRRLLFVAESSNKHSLEMIHSSHHQFHNNENDDDAILGTIRMDYSAANEYIRAHYGDQSPRLPLYFEQDESIETVYDARYGVHCINNISNEEETNPLIEDTKKKKKEEKTAASLKTCGFTLLSSAITREADDDNADWNNLEWIQRNCLPQWREHLKELYCNSNHQRTIRHMLFWNPMLRGPPPPSNKPTTTVTTTLDNNDNDNNAIRITPKASYAALPHIDMDVNAYYETFEDFLDLMENNEVEVLDVGGDGTSSANQRQRRRQDILDSIQNKHRGFAIVNAWCNVGKHPVGKDPLGLFSVQYDKETASIPAAFPMAAPNMKTSRWYAFSNMIPNDEVLFFCQYDRDVSWPSDLWHCSLDGMMMMSTTQGQQQQEMDLPPLPPRESFDIRCLLVFEEEVPLDRDRFQQRANNDRRMSSLLSLEESGCFCEGQFEERQKEEEDTTTTAASD